MVQFLSFRPGMRQGALQFFMLSIVLLFTVSLAACGGSGSGSSSSSSGPITLTLWGWINGMDKASAIWNKAHPDIQVKWSNVGSGPVEYSKIFTAIKANNAPDVAMVEYQVTPTFETTGAIVDLSAYGANSVKDQFPAWVWNQVTLGNAVYGIPGDIGPMALYYRQDLFDKYHIAVPTTWAQYADAAAKLHAADPNSYITDLPPRNPGWFAGLMWQAGARMFAINGQSWKVTINQPQAQQVAGYWQGLIDKKLIKTGPDFDNSWYHDLQTGAVATWITAPWGAGIIQQNAPQTAGKWRVAPIPQWQDGQTIDGNWGGSASMVFKSTKHPKEAAEFAQWLFTNQDSLAAQIKGNGIYPAYSPALSSPLVNGGQAFFGNQNIFEIFQPASTKVDVSFQWGPTMEQVYSDMGDNFANAANGKGTLSDGLNAVQQSTVTYMKKQGFSVTDG